VGLALGNLPPTIASEGLAVSYLPLMESPADPRADRSARAG